MFDRVEFRIGRTIIRRGSVHPEPVEGLPGETKAHISLRIDKVVLARFRADGPGWQNRMKAAGLEVLNIVLPGLQRPLPVTSLIHESSVGVYIAAHKVG